MDICYLVFIFKLVVHRLFLIQTISNDEVNRLDEVDKVVADDDLSIGTVKEKNITKTVDAGHY